MSEANRFVSATRPWELAKTARLSDADASDRLNAVLAVLYGSCHLIAQELTPFLPDAAERIAAALDHLDVQRGRALFPKFGEGA